MNISRNFTGGSRYALRAALMAAALAMLAPSSVWARPIPPSSAPDSVATNRRMPTVQVENNNWLDVHVYLIRDGEPFSLGVVTGPGEDRLSLPMTATYPGSDVHILVLTIGGNGVYESPSLQVNPGDVVDLNVENDLALSSVSVWPQK